MIIYRRIYSCSANDYTCAVLSFIVVKVESTSKNKRKIYFEKRYGAWLMPGVVQDPVECTTEQNKPPKTLKTSNCTVISFLFSKIITLQSIMSMKYFIAGRHGSVYRSEMFAK